ncbi:MAG: methionyl-tRNA formyltransferase [Defluviitaleaceae bacterium]|nr:methionyl-tRNA formyltransferase [Defluviitaleaceae bacterium]
MKIVFMGTPDFAATILAKLIAEKHDVSLVVSQPDRPVGRKKELFPTPVKKVALEHDIPVFQPESIKSDHEQVLAIQPDLIITAAYGQFIPKKLLDAPKFGCVNVHASLLPKYRGGASIHRAIIEGENETGITIMYMDERMDTGDIILQRSLPIFDADDVGTMFEKLSHLGAQLLIETLPLLESEIAPRTPQNEAHKTYAWNITREQEAIDWNKPARSVFNHIRGLHPWPVAYTKIGDVHVKVFKSIELQENHHASPGKIVQVSGEGIDVACKDHQIIRLLDVQLSGKKRMPLKDLLNGVHPFVPGEIFD